MCDQFGLGPWNKHPSIDEQVESAKRPMAKDILQWLTSAQALQHCVEMRNRTNGRGNVENIGELAAEESTRLFTQPTRLRATDKLRRFGPKLTPRDRVARVAWGRLAADAHSPLAN
jgi:hypothetical protein